MNTNEIVLTVWTPMKSCFYESSTSCQPIQIIFLGHHWQSPQGILFITGKNEILQLCEKARALPSAEKISAWLMSAWHQ